MEGSRRSHGGLQVLVSVLFLLLLVLELQEHEDSLPVPSLSPASRWCSLTLCTGQGSSLRWFGIGAVVPGTGATSPPWMKGKRMLCYRKTETPVCQVRRDPAVSSSTPPSSVLLSLHSCPSPDVVEQTKREGSGPLDDPGARGGGGEWHSPELRISRNGDSYRLRG